VSLLGFQQALADMVATPSLVVAVRGGELGALEAYDLTPRERRRLEVVAAQPGMEVNCTLYRTNRLTPIAMLLPHTCFVLGDRLTWVAERFWDSHLTELQFRTEVERFAAFLQDLIRSGELDEPLLEEILAFELAANELRFLPRRQLAEAARSATGPGLRLHPLVRLVRFRHDPYALLERLAATERPPYELEEGEFALVLIAGPDELDVRVVDEQLAVVLEALEGGTASLEESEADLLLAEGLAVRAA